MFSKQELQSCLWMPLHKQELQPWLWTPLQVGYIHYLHWKRYFLSQFTLFIKGCLSKKRKIVTFEHYFLSLGSIFKRCFSLYALYIQYSRNRTKCLDTLIVNQVDVQNNFCTTNDQIAHGTWMNIFLYVV